MKRTTTIWTILVSIAILAVGGCSDDSVCPRSNNRPQEVPATLAVRVDRSNQLAVDLYQQLADDPDNLLVSPHSVATTFGMAYAGARGVTEREIATALHFNYPPAGFHSALCELNAILESRGASVGWEAFRIHVANSAWGRDDAVYVDEYRDTLSVHYGADMRYVDFAVQPETARAEINQWVSDETGGFIQELIGPGDITPATYLVLANALLFQGHWLHQFDPDYTSPGPFTRRDGSQVTAQLMVGEEVFPYATGEGYAAVGLPYMGEECTMFFILPDEGLFDAFESGLTSAVLDTIVAGMTDTHVLVKLPRFAFGTKYDLGTALQAMGLVGAFYPGANFSGMDGTDDGAPWISFVAHQSYIAVDEYGTMAYAGTAMGLTIGIPPRFEAVRPFIFVIRDNETGTILFIGRVLDPTAH